MSFFDEVQEEVKPQSNGGIVYTAEQNAIFEATAGTNRSLIIIATAGSGKTSTIIESAKKIPNGKKVAFMAFNRDIAEELKKRVPRNSVAMTLNSLGHSSVLRAMPKATFDSVKMYKIYSKFAKIKGLSDAFSKENKRTIINLVGIGKTSGITPNLPLIKRRFIEDTPQAWKRVFFEYGMKCGKNDLDKVVEIASEMLKESLKLSQTMLFDYTDQIVMPVLYGWETQKFDVVYLDETQDISDLKLELVISSLKEGARLIAVGDPNQAIYGFAGAQRDIMDRIKSQFKCVEFSLSNTFRCAKNIVLEANKIVPTIRSLSSAAEGVVNIVEDANPEKVIKVDDMVVCRTNAPLMTLAVRLFTLGTPFSFRGNLEFVDKAKEILKGAKGLNGAQIADQCEEMIKTLKAAMADGVNASDDIDVANFILSIGSANPTMNEKQLIEKITEVFAISSSEGSTVKLYTIHKAKGLESDRVFFLNNHEIPHERAKTAWELEQEENMRYVAITRAKKELHYIKIAA